MNLQRWLSAACVALMFAACDPSTTGAHIQMPPADSVMAVMREHHVPTVGIAIIDGDTLRESRVFGSLPGYAAAPAGTLFNLASVTKPFLSTLTLKLVSDGQWTLDEPLAAYWVDPDVANDPRHLLLTTRHVLTHQSGLPNWRGHEPGGKLGFAFAPGTDWKYSGEGFEYLRQALEHKFHRPMEVLVDSLIFRPLGMTSARYTWDAGMDSTLYAGRHRADGTPFDAETWHEANASNLAMTTVDDYARFAAGVLRGDGLSAAVRAEMMKTQVTTSTGATWGLGWHLVRGLPHDEVALMHTGRNAGMNTLVVILPTSGRGVVVFTNGEEGDAVYRAILREALDIGVEIADRMG